VARFSNAPAKDFAVKLDRHSHMGMTRLNSEVGYRIGRSAAAVLPPALLTPHNAAKHGKGTITVRLETTPEHGPAFRCRMAGPLCPDGFHPGSSKGMGLRIAQADQRPASRRARPGIGRRLFQGGHPVERGGVSANRVGLTARPFRAVYVTTISLTSNPLPVVSCSNRKHPQPI